MANALLQVQQEAASQRTQIEGAIERARLQTESAALQTEINARAQAAAQTLLAEQQAAAMQRQHEIWAQSPPAAATAMALTQLAGKLQSIGHFERHPRSDRPEPDAVLARSCFATVGGGQIMAFCPQRTIAR